MATRSPGFLGRGSERDALDGLLTHVRGGRSDVLVIRGEAGIGKTALLRYAARQAAGFRVAQVTGVEAEMELPFAGTHQLCAPMLERLDALPPPQRDALSVALGLTSGDIPDRFLVGLAVLGLISAVAEERPLLCLVEDAQWLDAASSQILGFVARRVLAESVAIVVAVREPGGSGSGGGFDGLAELRLDGLQEESARALLSGAVAGRLDDRVRDRIIAETRANPLALLELPRRMTAAELAGGFEVPSAGEIPAYIEDQYLRRVDELPDATQRLMLLAAADPLGDATLVWRAGRMLDIDTSALAPAEDAELLKIDARVRFRHPLVRSAVYRAASPDNRQRVHEVLAEVIDPEADADRRAWHRALAAAGPEEVVAAELERSADRAQARGGIAATAAFLQRAVALTPDPMRRRARALAAAEASLQAGAFDAARGLLATAEAGALDELQRARIELLRAEVAFASRRDSTAPASLLRAAKRLEPLDAELARASYLEALSAALFAARLAGPGGGAQDVANAVHSAPAAASPRSPADVLLDGWAAMFANGCAAAAPTLREALQQFGHPPVAADQIHLLWLVTITAPVVWDDARWDDLSRRHVELARSSGAVSELPLALNSRSYVHLFRGEPEVAAALVEEARVAIEATGAGLTPWGALAFAALRGREQDAATVLDAAMTDATQRGEGISLTVIAWARAVLYNGLRVHDRALAAAEAAIGCPTNTAAAAWGMVELIEAAARVGEPDAADQAAGRFAEIAYAAGTDWALGVNARSRALLNTGATAEQLYKEALDHLGRCQMRMDLARAHLLYGEWLRRESRRVDARAQLRAAHEQFTSMGMEAFAQRAGSELLATGENARKRSIETREDLTAQERHLAQLARDGLSNAEIGARVFLSPRTVEWHLHHVFSKLGIRSRRELARALPDADSHALVS
jgi:DNA-binding CsgD family transcriptional regulator